MEDNFKKMLDMMELMKMFGNAKDGGMEKEVGQEENYNEEKMPPPSKTFKYYDEEIHTPALRSIKSAIPYLEFKYQKSIGVMIKFIELQLLLEMYAIESETLHKNSDENWQRGMLAAMRPHMDSDKQDKIDMLIRMLDLKEITTKMSGTERG